MNKSVLVILFSAASLYAQDTAFGQAADAKATAAKTTKTTKSAKSTQTTQPAPHTGLEKAPVATAAPGIPKNAEPLGNGRFRVVDSSGASWIYQNTPFGVMKTPEADLQPVTPIPIDVKAYPKGDEIRFEKQSPFGTSVWTKKRSDELSEVEKNALATAEKTTASTGKN
jgi:hypothetical protein